MFGLNCDIFDAIFEDADSSVQRKPAASHLTDKFKVSPSCSQFVLLRLKSNKPTSSPADDVTGCSKKRRFDSGCDVIENDFYWIIYIELI